MTVSTSLRHEAHPRPREGRPSLGVSSLTWPEDIAPPATFRGPQTTCVTRTGAGRSGAFLASAAPVSDLVKALGAAPEHIISFPQSVEVSWQAKAAQREIFAHPSFSASVMIEIHHGRPRTCVPKLRTLLLGSAA